jgi:hypothetical protein
MRAHLAGTLAQHGDPVLQTRSHAKDRQRGHGRGHIRLSLSGRTRPAHLERKEETCETGFVRSWAWERRSWPCPR